MAKLLAAKVARARSQSPREARKVQFYTGVRPTSKSEQKRAKSEDAAGEAKRRELIDEQEALRAILTNVPEDQVLGSFFKWLTSHGWWDQFWSHFRGDGTMDWKEFEEVVHWGGRWSGDKRRVFRAIARHCKTDGGEEPHLTAAGTLDLKRWWETQIDKGKVDMANVAKFKDMFVDYYSSLGIAWRRALDPEDLGSCCFLVFVRAAHAIGVRHHLKTIWAEITAHNPNRNIFYRDWDPDGDRLLSRFAVGLSIKYGHLQVGWNAIIKKASGRLTFVDFADVCLDFGLDRAEAKWLFKVLDIHEKSRTLTEYTKIKFLLHWDPGHVKGMTLQSLTNSDFKVLGQRKTQTEAAMQSVKAFFDEKASTPFSFTRSHPFQFVLQLTKAEHEEYQKRLRSRSQIVGFDPALVATNQKKKAEEARQKEETRFDFRARAPSPQ